MSDIEEMIGDILNNPSKLKMIMDTAGSLLGGGEKSHTISDISSQKESFNEDKSNILSDEMVSIIRNFMKDGKGVSGDKTALFSAVKPWLSEKRGKKLDNAVKLVAALRMARVFLKKTEGELI